MDMLTLSITAMLIQISDSYVLLPRGIEQEKHSNIDADLKKSSKRYAQDMARQPKYVRHERDYPKNNEYNSNFNKKYPDNELTNKDSAINSEKIGAIVIKLMDMFTKKFNSGAFRTSTKDIKAKSIQFRTGKSSILYEIDSETVVKAIRDLLASNGLRRFVKSIIKQSNLSVPKEVNA